MHGNFSCIMENSQNSNCWIFTLWFWCDPQYLWENAPCPPSVYHFKRGTYSNECRFAQHHFYIAYLHSLQIVNVLLKTVPTWRFERIQTTCLFENTYLHVYTSIPFVLSCFERQLKMRSFYRCKHKQEDNVLSPKEDSEHATVKAEWWARRK